MITRYGIEFNQDSPEAAIELWMYRNQDQVLSENGTVLGQAYHMKKAILSIFGSHPSLLIWHPWLDEHIDIWCDNRFATIFGPAACGKSNDFGLIALMDWWAAPTDTCTFVCSTTKPMLEKRIWESIVRYFNYGKNKCPGVVSKVRTAIINKDDEGKSSDQVKAGITGVAVQMGTVEEAVSNLIGAHLPYVRLIVDEMQATRLAAVEARKNLTKGCKEFKFIGMGNPMSFLDPLGTFSEPLEGWSSVSVENKQWDTRYGRCYHFDGFDSPAITEPDGKERYPFLINESQIEADIKENGGERDHPDIWTMCRGWPPPEGASKTVLSPAFISKFKMQEDCEWEYEYYTIAGLDPAFTSDGDDCVFLMADIGTSRQGTTTIRFHPPEKLTIQATASDPIAYQIASQTIQRCQENEVKPFHFGIDESGTQSIGDVIEMMGFQGIHRVNFGERASSLPVSMENPIPSCEYYGNKVSEMWYAMRQFGKYNQIRGMDTQIMRDFCERLVIKLKPVTLEPKGRTTNTSMKGMKARINRSPDYGDTAAIVLDVVRNVIGLLPGDGIDFYQDSFMQSNVTYDFDGSPEKYSDGAMITVEEGSYNEPAF